MTSRLERAIYALTADCERTMEQRKTGDSEKVSSEQKEILRVKHDLR